MRFRLNAARRPSFISAVILWILGLAGTVLQLEFIPESLAILALVASSVLLVAASVFREI